MWQYLRNKWDSLIFRLLLYFLIAVVALAIVLGISFSKRVKPHLQQEILPNVERYIEYLIDDIGTPPDLAVAQRLADELPFELRIEGQGVDWSSSAGLSAIDDYRFRPAPPPYEDVYLSHHRRAQYLLIRRQNYDYLFSVDNSFRRGAERRHGLLFLGLGCILLALYFTIGRLLRPVAAMSEQVRRIGGGDLEQNLEIPGRSELAQLAAGINRMSAQIKSMLEGKSAMLLAISHELRSPITRMRVNLELLEPGEIQQKLIDDVREMERLVAAILESEKLSSGHAPLNRSHCRLDQLIEEVVRAHAEREHILLDLAPISAEVDPLRFKLLLKNLIDNACDYSDPSAAAVEVRLYADAGGHCFEVRDRGPGIPEDEIPRLTEAFYRPDGARSRETGGYGLGLYLCQLIVAAHGASLDIESSPGSGTRVTVRLPLDNS